MKKKEEWCPLESCPYAKHDGYSRHCTEVVCHNQEARERAMEEPDPAPQLDESALVRGGRCMRLLHNVVKRKHYDPKAHKQRK